MALRDNVSSKFSSKDLSICEEIVFLKILLLSVCMSVCERESVLESVCGVGIGECVSVCLCAGGCG